MRGDRHTPLHAVRFDRTAVHMDVANAIEAGTAHIDAQESGQETRRPVGRRHVRFANVHFDVARCDRARAQRLKQQSANLRVDLDVVCDDANARMIELEAFDRQRPGKRALRAFDPDADALESAELTREERNADRRVNKGGDERNRNQEQQRDSNEDASAHQNCVDI